MLRTILHYILIVAVLNKSVESRLHTLAIVGVMAGMLLYGHASRINCGVIRVSQTPTHKCLEFLDSLNRVGVKASKGPYLTS
eukprot:COSAG05_NODE_15544_length_367_cov_0.555970_1_plen_82_part_00